MTAKLAIDMQNVRDNLALIPSFQCSDMEKDNGLYFYHFSKTGGTSVSAFLVALGVDKGPVFGQTDGHGRHPNEDLIERITSSFISKFSVP